jgi:tRNA pseudouridine38-40 synthase
MATYRLTLEYFGTGFAGWARQPGQRTVQGVVTQALETILAEPIELAVAGRTDAGVHASGQVASFRCSHEPDGLRLARSLNGLLPPDAAVVAAERADDGFDARRQARSRTYCYRILARPAPSPFERDRALWWPRALDREHLEACAASLAGTHDFTAFTPTKTDHVRFDRKVLSAEWRSRGDVLELWIEADSFMRQMVRVLVGTMLDVASGRSAVQDFVRLLDGAPRSAAANTVEPHGLYLASVRY